MLRNAHIQEAVNLIRAGKVIIFPTETVYGLMCDATNEDAIKKLFAIKARSMTNPISILVATKEMLKKYGHMRYKAELLLAKTYMPGPITLVLPKKNIPDILTGGKQTVGIRIPQLQSTRKLIRAYGKALAATSTNPSGQPPATNEDEVRKYFLIEKYGEKNEGTETENEEKIPFFDGGPCPLGIASTVVEMLDEKTLKIHRQGAIAKEELEKLFEKNNMQVSIV